MELQWIIPDTNDVLGDKYLPPAVSPESLCHSMALGAEQMQDNAGSYSLEMIERIRKTRSLRRLRGRE